MLVPITLTVGRGAGAGWLRATIDPAVISALRPLIGGRGGISYRRSCHSEPVQGFQRSWGAEATAPRARLFTVDHRGGLALEIHAGLAADVDVMTPLNCLLAS